MHMWYIYYWGVLLNYDEDPDICENLDGHWGWYIGICEYTKGNKSVGEREILNANTFHWNLKMFVWGWRNYTGTKLFALH